MTVTEDYQPQYYLDRLLAFVEKYSNNAGFISQKELTELCNAWADYWRYYIGVNVIPANSRAKVPLEKWKQYQDSPIPEQQYNEWKSDGRFNNGMAIITGKVWQRKDLDGYYLAGIDADNHIAIREILTRNSKIITIQELASKTVVEQHKNNEKMHCYLYTIGKPLRDKTSDIGREGMDPNTMPSLEVKASSKFLMYCSPSMHKSGHPLSILGTYTPIILGDTETDEMQEHLDAIYKKYGLVWNSSDGNICDNQVPIEELFKPGFPTLEGHNRHERLLRMMESLLARNIGILTLEQVKEIVRTYNTIEYFDPPLNDQEFEKQWKCAIDFISKKMSDGTQQYYNQHRSGDTDDSSHNNQSIKMSVSQAKREKTGYLQVNGNIVGISPVYNMVKSVDLKCSNCDYSNHIDYHWPRYKPHQREITKCPDCRRAAAATLTPDYVSVVDIELQDSDTFNDLERLWVKLFEENTLNIAANETVSITGQIHVLRRNDNSGNNAETVLYAQSIEYPKKQEVRLTQEDTAQIKQWKKELEERGNNVIDELIKIFAPEFIETDHIKRSVLITCANAGIRNDERRLPKRLRINLFMLGDPGLAKTEFLKKAIRLIPNSRYTGGQNATGLSLTAHVSKEDGGGRGDGMYMLRYGPIPRTKGAICAVNEFGQLPSADHKHFLDCMDDDSFPVTKHGFDIMVEAYTTIIASANPIGGRWDDPNRIDISRIPTSAQVLDRFDIILILTENKDPEYLRRLASQKREVAENYKNGLYDGNEEFIRKYLAHARTIQPIVSKDAYDVLSEYFARVGESGIVDGLQRKFDTLLRITIAIAKLKLKECADKEDAHDTMKFYNVMLQQYKQITSLIVKSPRDAAVEEILNVVKDLDGVPIKFTEAAHIARQKNSQVRYHLGENLKVDTNHKLRDVLEIIERDRSIEITSRMPIILRWKGSQQQWIQADDKKGNHDFDNNINESDESGESDAYNSDPNTKNSQGILNEHHIKDDQGHIQKLFESKEHESMSDRSDKSDSTVTRIQISCPYCSITDHYITFDNASFLEKHVIQRHPNWTAWKDVSSYLQFSNQF